ncbi:MAG: hypothetical protein Kow0031_20250 [Anaerolineae bacterium]
MTPAYPLISIILPVYNGEAFLAEALDSVIQQPYRPLEVVVVNDGSTDETAAIVQRYADSNPVSIVHHQQANRGLPASLNRGLELAAGEWISFIDADDCWAGDKLTVQTAPLLADPSLAAVWGTTQMFAIDNHDASRRILLGAPWHGTNLGSGLFRRSVFDRIGNFDATLAHGDDFDWYLRLKSCPEIRQLKLAEIALFYRYHGHNMWLGQPDAFRQNLPVIKKHLKRRRAEAEAPGAPGGETPAQPAPGLT